MGSPRGFSRCVRAAAAALLAALWGSACSVDQAAPLDAAPGAEVDVILTNGAIYTMNEAQPKAQALAVSRGLIVAAGSTEEIEALKGPRARVIDLEGRAVLPGFHDVHVHPLFAGIANIQCRVAPDASLEEAQQAVKVCADQTPKGGWIVGGQWNTPALGETPHRSMLDEVSTEHPILLSDTSGHSVWVNSKALELGGITAATPDPEGGIIERDAAGEPTGLLHELASGPVWEQVPPHSDETLRSALTWALDEMLAQGITSYTEASTGFVGGLGRETALYAALADEGLLKQRVRLCLTWEPGDEAAEAVIAARNWYGRERVSPNCVKIFLDGVPTDSHTAAMLEPYADVMEGRTDRASRYGLLLVEQDVLNEAVTRFDRMGLTVKFHAAGDAAVRAGLDAIEAARQANGFSGRLHDAGHCTFAARADLPRARALGATFEVSPYLWSPSPIGASLVKAVGAERMKRIWPVREMLEAGALVVAGSDWAVVPSVNPWVAVETLITREEPGGSEQSYGKEQGITLEQALRIFTVNAARHEGMADQVGRLAPGLRADLVVLDRDPYQTPVRELHRIAVEKTLIDGKIVYSK